MTQTANDKARTDRFLFGSRRWGTNGLLPYSTIMNITEIHRIRYI